MRNFQETFETRKRSFISAFSICMTVPLKNNTGVLVAQIANEVKEILKNKRFSRTTETIK